MTRAATSAEPSVAGGQQQIGGVDGRNFDHQVDPVEQRPRQARLILPDAPCDRLPIAAVPRIERVAAAAGIHGGDELESRRIDNPVIGAGDGNLAGFERLAQRESRTCAWNSGSSSRKSTPWCASEISPGRAWTPPPTSAAIEANDAVREKGDGPSARRRPIVPQPNG